MSYPIKILFAIVLVALVYQFINSGELQTVLADITVSATKQVAGSILNLINAPAFVSTASLLIVASGFLACAWYWIEGVQPRRRVVQATKAELADLLALTREGVKKEADVWPTLERIVPRDGFFATSWGLFAASRQRGHGGERLIPFSWYIAQDSAVDGRRRCNLMSSLPGYFTTVGLI